MKLILHPGNAKCGSTSIQSFLSQNVDELKKNKIGVVDQNLQISNRSPTPNNAGVYFKNLLYSGNSFEKTLKQSLDKLIYSAKKIGLNKVVIAAEILGYTNHEHFKFMHSLLAEKFNEVKVVYYIRRQDEVYLSIWQESYFGQGLSFEETYQKGLLQDHFQYEETLNYLCEVYERDNVICRPVSKTGLINGNLIDDFNIRSGINLSRIIQTGQLKANRSLNPYLCEIVSRSGLEIELYKTSRFKSTLERRIENTELLYKKVINYIAPAMKNEILNLNRASNQKILDQYFPELDINTEFSYHKIEEINPLNDRKEILENLKDIMAVMANISFSLLNENKLG